MMREGDWRMKEHRRNLVLYLFLYLSYVTACTLRRRYPWLHSGSLWTAFGMISAPEGDDDTPASAEVPHMLLSCVLGLFFVPSMTLKRMLLQSKEFRVFGCRHVIAHPVRGRGTSPFSTSVIEV